MTKLIIIILFIIIKGVTQLKPHHILTISNLEETRRPRRHSPHSQTTGLHGHKSPPHLGSLSGPITLRSGISSKPTSPLFPLGATESSPSLRPGGGRNASSVRYHGSTMSHCASFFPQSPWQDNEPSFPSPTLSFSPTIQHLPRSRLSFDLSQPDSVEVPHNFLASPEPEDVSPPNGTSPKGDPEQQKEEDDFTFNSLHKDSIISVGEDMRTELEIEETLLNEGVAMNCGGQIVVEVDDPEDFWERNQEVHKGKSANLPHSAASTRDDFENTSSDEDMEHYFDFSRTIVSHTGSKELCVPPSTPSSQTMAQLDGVDDGTESDASITTNDNAQKDEASSQTQILTKIQNGKNGLESESQQNVDNVTQEHIQSLSSKGASNKHTDSFMCPISVAKSPIISPHQDDHDCDHSAEVKMTSLPMIEQHSESPLVDKETVLPLLSHDGQLNAIPKVPETSHPEEVLQGSSSGFDAGAPLVLERCDSTLHQQSEDCNPIASQSDSGNLVSSTEISTQGLVNHSAANAGEQSIAVSTNANQTALLELLPPFLATDSKTQSLPNPLHMYSCLPIFNQPPLASITLQPVTSPQELTVQPPDPLSTKMTTLTPVDVTQSLLSVVPQNDPVLSTSATFLPTASTAAVSVPVYSTKTQPLGSAALTIVSSSATPASGFSAQCSSAPVSIQTTSSPVILNGFSTTSFQKDATSGHTISINFSAPRPTLEPQQSVLPQALPGHAILTVKEVGGPNVDTTPHVLLVNRLGQIFVKNPESNTFQLPTPNSPSFNCVTQIASLLQSNALSATLAAAGNLSTPLSGANMAAASPSVRPAVQNQTSVTQLLANNSNGAVPSVNVKKPRKNAKTSKDDAVPDSNKPKKKKDSNSSKKSKSAKPAENPPMTPAESAEAIINQAMASNYTPKWSGLRTLSPSSLVLPPGLLIEPETPASPPSPFPTPTPTPTPRPRTHVRMKRVSSLSDRIVTKKSKVDFLPPEPVNEIEDQRRQSISNRASGVRIKTPTVKGILNLDELKEEHLSDSDSSG